MTPFSRTIQHIAVVLCIFPAGLAGCKASDKESPVTDGQPPFRSSVASAPPQSQDDALPSEKTGGFNGKRALAHVAKQVSFGPRPSGSEAIAKLQNYIQSELSSYGCKVEADDFHADTPIGRLSMKNIVAKIPGEKPGIIMLATHYDTARSARDPRTGEVHPMPTFVGA